MKKLFTYTVPRPFFGYNIPIAIQSCYLRDYASKKKMLFSLPVTEVVRNNSYSIFKKNFKKKNISIAMTSIFILPIKNKKLFNTLMQDLHQNVNFHFVLENFIFNKKELIQWRREYLLLSKLSNNYNNLTKMLNQIK